jgi:hypothetical protein
VHFIYDSPSGQYRNRTNAYLLSAALDRGFHFTTWNFCESGHGKGAPDGVGAAAKRQADEYVTRVYNILNAKDFRTVVSSGNILAWEVIVNLFMLIILSLLWSQLCRYLKSKSAVIKRWLKHSVYLESKI